MRCVSEAVPSIMAQSWLWGSPIIGKDLTFWWFKNHGLIYYLYRTFSCNKVWTHVYHRFESCSWRVGDLEWPEYPRMSGWKQDLRPFSVKHSIKTIHDHPLVNTLTYFGMWFPLISFAFSIIAAHKEASQLICNVNQLIGFHMN